MVPGMVALLRWWCEGPRGGLWRRLRELRWCWIFLGLELQGVVNFGAGETATKPG